jgi:hypothetical protein
MKNPGEKSLVSWDPAWAKTSSAVLLVAKNASTESPGRRLPLMMGAVAMLWAMVGLIRCFMMLDLFKLSWYEVFMGYFGLCT